MIFVTVIGGIGSIEGPIIGTVVFFALQQAVAHGAWYLRGGCGRDRRRDLDATRSLGPHQPR